MPSAKRTKFQIRSDASKQRWVRDDLKEAYWRKHIAAWKSSKLSKRAYCKANNLSESSFNAWSREISIREREYAPTDNAAAILSLRDNPFVPIKLVPDRKNDLASTPQTTEAPTQNTSARVEVVVPGGAVLHVSESCSVDFVAKLFSVLRSEVPPC